MSVNSSSHRILKLGNYTIRSVLGKGSFGVVYSAVDDKGNEFAVKAECIETNCKESQLDIEYEIYLKLQGVTGIPNISYYGMDDKYRYLVMDKFDSTVSQMLTRKKNLSLKTIVMISKRILFILKKIHEAGWIYRDLKPENIMISGNSINLVDFGLSKPYVRGEQHIEMIENKVLTGTARYASVATHKGLEQSRRDDIESLLYVAIFLLKGGKLPWTGLTAPTRNEKFAKIGKIKELTLPSQLCKGLEGGKHFEKMLEYARKISFEEEPNYDSLNEKLDSILKEKKLKDDGVYDWISKPIVHDNRTRTNENPTCFSKFLNYFNFCKSDSQISQNGS